MGDRCAGGVKLKFGKRCPVCDAGSGDQCAKAALRDFEERQALRAALRIFLGHDDRFQVAVGGNPNAVEKMLNEARALLG
jgi:hypothetical protein